jgi:hypothetical protein
VNAIYFPLFEEPGLRRRFGEDYERYRGNVPRWIPRFRPWDPRSEQAGLLRKRDTPEHLIGPERK